jgi:hypothetical protein
MVNKEKELLSAIKETERFSGDDSFDGDSFDGDEMSYASGGRASKQLSDPYVIQFENTNLTAQTAVLFGYNDFFGSPTGGQPAGVTVTNLQGGTYSRLLAQSNNKMFKIGKWRFQSSTPAQLQITVNINHVDANGKQYSQPMNLSILKDANQFQSDILDVSKVVTVDGNTYLSFTILPSATVTISMFPIEIISGKSKLNGGSSMNYARAPRLSGKNVSPVIIQTSQGVRGIQ